MAIPAQLRDSLQQFEPLPPAVSRLLRELGREDDEPLRGEISALIEPDKELSARLLRIFNSTYYSGRYPIERLSDATPRFGLSALIDVLLTDHLLCTGWSAELFGLNSLDFWLHGSVASLAVIETIRENPRKDISRAATLAALLHDVGKVAMSRVLLTSAKELSQVAQTENITFAEAERRVFGCDHSDVSAALAQLWGFPDFLVEAIERHHKVPLPDPTASVDAVALANLVAKTIGVGLGSEGLNFEMDPGCYTRLGLDFNAFCRVCARTAIAIKDMKAAYGLSD
ncbi:MAG: HDOD domain-containing protein [Acidobacteria bacterium]|nr:MAG: HDOD domain-containing protein [Acidobacteriota bacterium]